MDIQTGDDGQVYITEGEQQLLHAKVRDQHEVEIQCGMDDKVIVQKMYGPLIMVDVRVSMDINACEWVIERESGAGDATEWREVARIPGQLPTDFAEDLPA